MANNSKELREDVRGGDPKHLSQASDVRDAGTDRPVVLIVDDVADNLLAFEGMLRRDDVEIVTALSGRAALETLLNRDVAVAILDVQMPEMDGFELATLMRGTQKTLYVPIVFVTAGSREQSYVFKGYESGAVDYLLKPVDPMVLRGKVDIFVTLEKHRQQLRHADRMREMFISVLGHDLQNPLSAIIMAAQLASKPSNGVDNGDMFQRILRNGNRMLRMIDQLLDFSRFRMGGGISLDPKPSDLRALTDQVLGEFEDLRQRFQVEVCGDTAGTWDADRVLQVVSNLVGNAVQHSPPDSSIRINIQGSRDDTVVYEVHNIGTPIPQKLRNVLFEPFRGSEGGGNKSKRLGLGLYIARQIVLAHGGILSFESGEESGTCFIVSIPRHANGCESKTGVPGKDTGQIASESLAPSSVANKPSMPRVLIAENEDDQRQMLADVLQDSGYMVDAVANGNDAVQALNSGAYDVAVLDVGMPGKDGLTVLKELRQRKSSVPVLMLSAFATEADEMRHRASGANGTLPKPYNIEKLLVLIKNTINA